MTPLVTIAIPCFNNASSLARAVESALAQTWPATETIVVDDGSTDGSATVARQFGERVRVLSGEHRGAPHARNLAWREARGEWVQFLDADDFLEPTKIATQMAETGGGAAADVIYSPVWVESGEPVGRERSVLDPGADLYAQWLAWQLPQTGGGLWRKSALAALGGWKEDQPCCQEHELYLRALMAECRFVFAPTPGAVYRIWSDDTLCRRDPLLVVRERTKLIDRLRAWLESRGEWTPAHQRLAGRVCLELARSIAGHDLAAAAAYFAERRSRGLIRFEGPAAPASFRLACALLGFRRSEMLGRLLRDRRTGKARA
jgi:glycosyltransferase involved in cell wall biosynthesis